MIGTKVELGGEAQEDRCQRRRRGPVECVGNDDEETR